MLVGLRLFAQLGVLHDERVLRAQALLGKLYGGARVDALDLLLLPNQPAPALDTTRSARRVYRPTTRSRSFPTSITEPGNLRALSTRGLPPPHRKKLDQAKLDPAAKKLYARALPAIRHSLRQGRGLQHAAEDRGVRCRRTTRRAWSEVSRRRSRPAPPTRRILMLKGQPATGLGSLTELDALAKEVDKTSGMASFDGAYILELVPRRDDASFWEDVGRPLRPREQRLTDPKDKERAAEYANSARSTAKSLVAAEGEPRKRASLAPRHRASSSPASSPTKSACARWAACSPSRSP